YSWVNGNITGISPVADNPGSALKSAKLSYDETQQNTLKIRQPIITEQPLHMNSKLVQHSEQTLVVSGTKVTEDYSYEYDNEGRIVKQVVKGKNRSYLYTYAKE